MAGAWRFLDTGARDGFFNMTLDNYFADDAIPPEPILRFYSWRPFAISLGYHQKTEEINLAACRNSGIDVVRRPTGGRAIYHAEEITYSVIIPDSHPLFKQTTLEIYNLISKALVDGLVRLGLPVAIEVHKHALSRSYQQAFACFATTAQYEIQFENRKLVGSAQRRFSRAILQHGSIITGGQHTDLFTFLNISDADQGTALQRQLEKRTVSLTELLGHTPKTESVKQALQAGFQETFKTTFESRPLTDPELLEVEKNKQHFHNSEFMCNISV